jgi:serine/threonine protein phosphatase 1
MLTRRSLSALWRAPNRMAFIRRLFGGGEPENSSRRRSLEIANTVFYAIGDVHGCLDLLLAIEAQIDKDSAELGQPAAIILLGDIVDKGPNSAQVIDHILERQSTDRSYYCLAGNHEEAALDFLQTGTARSWWLQNGGLETLASYGIPREQIRRGKKPLEAVRTFVPVEHIEFLMGLPIAIASDQYFFSHAGADPARSLIDQLGRDLQWFRDGMTTSYQEFGKTVVHGHSVVPSASVQPRRINLDTGAFATGRLTAARLMHGQPPIIFEAVRSRSAARP